MPDIMAEVRGDWLGTARTDFLETIHAVVARTLGSPTDEPVARLVEHPETHYLIPHAAGPRFTRIEIVLFEGRPLEEKRALYAAMAQALTPFGVPPEDVKVILVEVSRHDVGFRGGYAAADVDLGYDIGATALR